jgi:hypothetical protein
MGSKLRQIFDRRFFIFVTLVFLVSFAGGLIWFWGETKAQTRVRTFKEFVAKNKTEAQEELRNRDETYKSDQEENTADIFSSPAVLGKTTETEVKETTIQAQTSLNTDSVNLISLANEAILKLKDCLARNDSFGLYDLAGEDLRTAFGREEFTEAISNGEKVLEVSILSDSTIAGEWAEITLELKYLDNVPQNYIVFFHLEEGVWKLFGTEEI